MNSENVLKNNVLIVLFLCGYLFSIALGWLILEYPFCQKSSVSQLDLLFTTISAVSTTGLAPIDIGTSFSFLGQFVLLFLIQLGGLGYMIFSSFLAFNLQPAIRHASSEAKQAISQHCFKEEKKTFSLAAFCFPSLPFYLKELIKQVLIYAFFCEFCEFLLLFFLFRMEGTEHALWNSLFLCISSFCTAGFSLFSSNLEGYQNHLGINLVLSFFSLLGAFGFFFWVDFFKISSSTSPRNPSRTHFFVRIIQPFCCVAILIGTSLFLLLTTLPEESSILQKLIISSFQVISTITTTGFNTIETQLFPPVIHFILILLMLFGVCLTGNGQDLKGTSLKGLILLSIHHLQNRTTSLWNQKCLLKRTQLALSSFSIYSFALLGSTFILKIIEDLPFFPLLFETASALCTVGISIGITPHLSPFGKAFLAFLMLSGRTTILILGFVLSTRAYSESKLTPV